MTHAASPATEQATTRGLIRHVLAADCGCSEAALRDDGVTIVAATPGTARFRWPQPARPLTLLTMGAGVVVHCAADRVAWAEATLAQQSREALFDATTIAQVASVVAADGQTLYGPTLLSACSLDRFRPAAPPASVRVELLDAHGLVDLYRLSGFTHALAYTTDTPRPDQLAAIAYRGQRVIGIAAASADSEALWQIGVDVVAEARGQGIGRAVVSEVTAAVLARGIVPFYGAAVSNLASRATALSLGYWPAWTALYARDRPPVAIAH
jgi:GNAT superfamily N-acetyltransferase